MYAYFDNAATTAVSQSVADAMRPYFTEVYGNPSSLHSVGQRAAEALVSARETVAKLLNAKPSEIYFTSGGSEADNQAILSAAHLGARKETRWHSFAENLDYPDKSDDWMKYVNSKYENGQLHMIYRELVGREARYEHND